MTDLSCLARQAESRDGFIAAKVAVYQQTYNLDDVALASQLGCSTDDLVHLKLCALPCQDHYDRDVERIAGHVHANVTELASILSD